MGTVDLTCEVSWLPVECTMPVVSPGLAVSGCEVFCSDTDSSTAGEADPDYAAVVIYLSEVCSGCLTNLLTPIL